MNSKFYLLALALGTLAACSNDNEMDNATSNSDLVPLEVTGSINGVKTRVTADSQWEEQDQIGITGASGNLTYTNKPYSYTRDGIFKKRQNEQDIYFGGATGTFHAYYPYNESVVNNMIEGNVGDRTKEHDFLYAEEMQVSKDIPTLKLKFDHKMCLLKLHMKAGTGFRDLDFNTMGLDGPTIGFESVHSSASFNTLTGEVTPKGEPTSITFRPTAYKEDGGYYYLIILCPETISDGMTFTLNARDGVPYKTKLTTNKEGEPNIMVMEPGKVYEYTITVSKTEMLPGDVTINDWTPAWEGSHRVEATV